MEGSVERERKIVLPPDIIYEVLLRLRVNTLCRFRYVSKSWHALVSDPGFAQDHHRRSQQNPLLLVATLDCGIPGCTKLHIISLDRESKNQICEFAVSINTARQKSACTAFTRLDLVCVHDGNSVYICNPATEELVVLSEKCSWNHCNYVQSKVGFGYLPSTKEYKVIRGIIPHGESECYELLTLGNGSCWKAIGNPPYSGLHRTPVFASGALHILSEYNFGIARFDLEREEWSKLPLPNKLHRELADSWALILRQVDGLLCIVDHGPDHRIDLWFLKDYDKGIWAKEYRICLPSPWVHSPFCLVPLSVEADGRILMVETARRKLQYYDPAIKSFQEIPTGKYNVGMNNISYYVESFMPLRGNIM